jgi:hypothetical protein
MHNLNVGAHVIRIVRQLELIRYRRKTLRGSFNENGLAREVALSQQLHYIWVNFFLRVNPIHVYTNKAWSCLHPSSIRILNPFVLGHYT